MTWTIICPGPSLNRLKEEELTKGPLVAVTTAVSTDLPITHWCYYETLRGDRNHYRRCVDKHPEMKIWHPIGLEGRLRQLLEEKGSGYRMPPGVSFQQMPRSELIERLPVEWKLGKFRGVSSVFWAVSMAKVLGAGDLELWGIDLEGEGNFDAVTGELIDNRRRDQWEAKWKSERAAWKKLLPGVSGVRFRVPGTSSLEAHPLNEFVGKT